MDFWGTALAQHGLAILVAAVFLEAVGLPVPAALALLVAGAAAARGVLSLPQALGGAVLAMLAGDTLMYLLGRYTGWWLLGLLCRISLNPEACILRSADSFYRRGRALLVFAKFLPGINTLAPPLAGSMNMRFVQFLRLDFAGAALYIASYFAAGYLFSGALAMMTHGFRAVGQIVGWAVMALVAGYLGFQVWLWIRARSLPAVHSVTPTMALQELAAGAHIYDVRSHGYLDAKTTRIRGSRRLDPNGLHQSAIEFPPERNVYLYCTCVRQATSKRVARELQKSLHPKGIRVAVIDGGLSAWKKAGLPVEPVPAAEMAALPLFR
jgi:membrane protein DedA with SNARE-associated domain/rhodanese-related sulfurtransferase